MKVRDIIVENDMDKVRAAHFKQKNTPFKVQTHFNTWLNRNVDPDTRRPYTDFYKALDAYKIANPDVAKAKPTTTEPTTQRSANFRGNQYTGGIPGERNDDDTGGDDDHKGVKAKAKRAIAKVSRAVQQGKQTARAAGDKTQSYMDKLSRISNIGVTR
jgi:hypothetical protein